MNREEHSQRGQSLFVLKASEQARVFPNPRGTPGEASGIKETLMRLGECVADGNIYIESSELQAANNSSKGDGYVRRASIGKNLY